MIAWSVATSRFFFFNDTATTEIYTLSLHDALPICLGDARDGEADSRAQPGRRPRRRCCLERGAGRGGGGGGGGGARRIRGVPRRRHRHGREGGRGVAGPPGGGGGAVGGGGVPHPTAPGAGQARGGPPRRRPGHPGFPPRG